MLSENVIKNNWEFVLKKISCALYCLPSFRKSKQNIPKDTLKAM